MATAPLLSSPAPNAVEMFQYNVDDTLQQERAAACLRAMLNPLTDALANYLVAYRDSSETRTISYVSLDDVPLPFSIFFVAPAPNRQGDLADHACSLETFHVSGGVTTLKFSSARKLAAHLKTLDYMSPEHDMRLIKATFKGASPP